MTRLTNLKLGDVIDRLSILALKASRRPRTKEDTAEEQALLRMVADKTILQIATLLRVNAELWRLENVIRAENPPPSTGVEIARMNDERAALVTQINGDPALPKVYEKTDPAEN